MIPDIRIRTRIMAVVCALLATCAVAHAQSAVDGFNPGVNGSVLSLAMQSDGKILVGGDFTALGGGTGTTTSSYISRLNADGSSTLPAITTQPSNQAVTADCKCRLHGRQAWHAGAHTSMAGIFERWRDVDGPHEHVVG